MEIMDRVEREAIEEAEARLHEELHGVVSRADCAVCIAALLEESKQEAEAA